MTDLAPEVVCDAGPLIHLHELGCLELLADFKAVLVPEQVRDEVAQHRPGALARARFSPQLLNVTISQSPQFQALVKTFSLDLGEQAALTVMRARPGAILLTDDAAARLAAKSLGFRAHGTLGILLRAVRRHQRTRVEVLALLRALPSRSSLHIRSDLLAEVVAEVESFSPDD